VNTSAAFNSYMLNVVNEHPSLIFHLKRRAFIQGIK
jgi:hypothetical protein